MIRRVIRVIHNHPDDQATTGTEVPIEATACRA